MKNKHDLSDLQVVILASVTAGAAMMGATVYATHMEKEAQLFSNALSEASAAIHSTAKTIADDASNAVSSVINNIQDKMDWSALSLSEGQRETLSIAEQTQSEQLFDALVTAPEAAEMDRETMAREAAAQVPIAMVANMVSGAFNYLEGSGASRRAHDHLPIEERTRARVELKKRMMITETSLHHNEQHTRALHGLGFKAAREGRVGNATVLGYMQALSETSPELLAASYAKFEETGVVSIDESSVPTEPAQARAYETAVQLLHYALSEVETEFTNGTDGVNMALEAEALAERIGLNVSSLNLSRDVAVKFVAPEPEADPFGLSELENGPAPKVLQLEDGGISRRKTRVGSMDVAELMHQTSLRWPLATDEGGFIIQEAPEYTAEGRKTGPVEICLYDACMPKTEVDEIEALADDDAPTI